MLKRKTLRELRTTKAKGANKLRLAKDLAKITQMELSRRIHLAQSQVCDDMNGKSTDMSLAKARAYAGVFGCTVDDLFPPDGASA
jgi:transcriptional regulator with XRE-family HTH domain